jgi:hypothetical protein
MDYMTPDDAAHWNPAAVDPLDEELDGAPDEEIALDEERLLPKGFAEWFIVAQTALPALLFLPGSQAYRLPLRIGAYVIPMVGFALWWFDRGARRDVPHPAQRWLAFVLMYLVLMIFHPLSESLLASTAQIGLYFAIFCSVFWAPAYVNNTRQLVRILAILLVCNGINSIVGVLQVYDPDRWMPKELSAIVMSNRDIIGAASYVGPNGRIIIRPPGLFDTPGAVCGPGTIAALLGLIFAVEQFAWWKRLVALGFALAGISAIYLSHVRANFVVALGMMAVYAVSMAVLGERKRVVGFSTLCVGIVMVGLTMTTIIGGESIRERFATLLEDDPRSLYYNSRGQQLETSFGSLAEEYPFGAGLARWGMMRRYFRIAETMDSQEVWAEIQPNAWMLDGGYFLLGLYSLALIVTAFYEWKLVRLIPQPRDRLWAAAVVSANIGTLALVFTFVPFGTQVGMQFWFLEGALHGAMAHTLRR